MFGAAKTDVEVLKANAVKRDLGSMVTVTLGDRNGTATPSEDESDL